MGRVAGVTPDLCTCACGGDLDARDRGRADAVSSHRITARHTRWLAYGGLVAPSFEVLVIAAVRRAGNPAPGVQEPAGNPAPPVRSLCAGCGRLVEATT